VASATARGMPHYCALTRRKARPYPETPPMLLREVTQTLETVAGVDHAEMAARLPETGLFTVKHEFNGSDSRCHTSRALLAATPADMLAVPDKHKLPKA